MGFAAVLGHNPFRVGMAWLGLPRVARRLATLGSETESRWDSTMRPRRALQATPRYGVREFMAQLTGVPE